ncbi:ATP-binding cassette domain-containing protein [Bacteroidales bacterium OttesenSCG-928-B11]|nr:ATP-binding cassette domain-containing protein [Bacteroidales bacterium OttesenSCG-928-E04]MDL2312488.1 ATP-binding cassette domain-containing protein [Bacteroidales bacterium OttesenSCG-928-B11]MDL2325719.1 ATP-binding cassette domain-containing protein [Bacteroidales bacterium OttesenSCG-928-A14]
MQIRIQQLKPNYMSEEEVLPSDIYLKESVVFEPGAFYLIHAASGKGKSSLLNFLYGLSFQYDGSVRIDNAEPNPSLRLSRLSYVFQDLRLFPELTVMENILLKNQLTGYKTIGEIESLLDEFGLLYKCAAPLSTLSLGQRQRVAIIRALCQPFNFLLLDEPFSHLDPANIEIAVNMLAREIKKQDAGLILTSLERENYFEEMSVLEL